MGTNDRLACKGLPKSPLLGPPSHVLVSPARILGRGGGGGHGLTLAPARRTPSRQGTPARGGGGQRAGGGAGARPCFAGHRRASTSPSWRPGSSWSSRLGFTCLQRTVREATSGPGRPAPWPSPRPKSPQGHGAPPRASPRTLLSAVRLRDTLGSEEQEIRPCSGGDLVPGLGSPLLGHAGTHREPMSCPGIWGFRSPPESSPGSQAQHQYPHHGEACLCKAPQKT